MNKSKQVSLFHSARGLVTAAKVGAAATAVGAVRSGEHVLRVVNDRTVLHMFAFSMAAALLTNNRAGMLSNIEHHHHHHLNVCTVLVFNLN